MAKNKKQDRSQQKSAPQKSQKSSAEHQVEQRITQATPADVARKDKQRRFGHN
ncbi:hypothetical protein ACIHFE_03785 [Streptomyces sp. NPDC052396]|uniref:hypothetical protein n=1 Tax=Streptomyces sp. NPDC052396 TaxID=3365689 RepID=UPI0037D30480